MSDIKDMGERASEIFAGTTSTSQVIKELFNESAPLFSTILAEVTRQMNSKPITLLDVGSYKGEFLQNVVSGLPNTIFDITAVDENATALNLNKVTQHIVVSPANNLPLNDRSFDISMMRYVLHWNLLEDQFKIISEAARVSKTCLIIQHLGAPDQNNESWNQKFEQLVSGTIEKLHRPTACFSSAKTIEDYFRTLPVTFSRVQYRRIENPSQGFRERFDLTDIEFDTVKDILDEQDFIMQVIWKIVL